MCFIWNNYNCLYLRRVGVPIWTTHRVGVDHWALLAGGWYRTPPLLMAYSCIFHAVKTTTITILSAFLKIHTLILMSCLFCIPFQLLMVNYIISKLHVYFQSNTQYGILHYNILFSISRFFHCKIIYSFKLVYWSHTYVSWYRFFVLICSYEVFLIIPEKEATISWQ